MSDNIQLNLPDTLGQIIATDDIGTVQHQLVKLEYGDDGAATMVSPSNPLPVTDAALALKDFSTQTTLAAVLAKLSADPATQTTLAAVLAKLTSDPATQTTLAAILAKIIAAPSTEVKQDALNTLVTTLNSIVATAGKQDIGNTSLNSIDAVKLDVALSTRLKPADTLAGVTAVGSITNALPSGSNAIGKLAANDGVDIGDATINNAAGVSAVNIQDGGNSITVDNAGTFATQITDYGGTNVLKIDSSGQIGGMAEARRQEEALFLISQANLYAQMSAQERASAGNYGYEIR